MHADNVARRFVVGDTSREDKRVEDGRNEENHVEDRVDDGQKELKDAQEADRIERP